MLAKSFEDYRLTTVVSSNESHSFLIRPDGGGEDAATEIEVGKTIPAWQEGVMDIHFINTTTGESIFPTSIRTNQK